MRVLRAVLTGLCAAADTAFVALYSKSAQDVLLNLLFFALASEIHTFLHESGHFLGGLFSGYRLCLFSVEPLLIVRAGEGVRVRFLSRRRGINQCVMIPPENAAAFRLYNLGGVLANAAACAVALGGVLMNAPFRASFFWVQTFFSGFLKVIANAVPCLRGGRPNDALTARILTHSKAAFEDYKLYLRLYAEIVSGGLPNGERFHCQRDGGLPNGERLYCQRDGGGLERIFYREIQTLLREYGATEGDAAPSVAEPKKGEDYGGCVHLLSGKQRMETCGKNRL